MNICNSFNSFCDVKRFIKVFLAAFLVLTLLQCDDLSFNNDKQHVSLDNLNKSFADENAYRFSPFFPGKPRNWMSFEEAKQYPKYDGMIEISRYWNTPQTEEQKLKADELYQRTLSNVLEKGWLDMRIAEEAGYKYEGTSHSHNLKYIFDGEFLNPEEPEYLMFYPLGDKMVLAGVMFVQDDIYSHGEQIGGSETVWHFHHYPEGKCIPVPASKEIMEKNKVEKGECEVGVFLHRSPEMLHVWFVDHPDGRFSSSMLVSNEVLSKSGFIADFPEKKQ